MSRFRLVRTSRSERQAVALSRGHQHPLVVRDCLTARLRQYSAQFLFGTLQLVGPVTLMEI